MELSTLYKEMERLDKPSMQYLKEVLEKSRIDFMQESINANTAGNIKERDQYDGAQSAIALVLKELERHIPIEQIQIEIAYDDAVSDCEEYNQCGGASYFKKRYLTNPLT